MIPLLESDVGHPAHDVHRWLRYELTAFISPAKTRRSRLLLPENFWMPPISPPLQSRLQKIADGNSPVVGSEQTDFELLHIVRHIIV